MVEQNEQMIEQTEELNEENRNEAQNVPEIDSKYRMIILAAQRAKQLQRGANARVDLDPRKHKFTRIALKELDHKKVNFEILEN